MNLPHQMRRIVVTAPATFEVTTVDRPDPGPEEVLVQTLVSGVCGSDLHAAHGKHPFVPLPYRPGHEVVGVVRAVGTDVSQVQVDQRVTVEPTLPCWHCKMCTTGRENLCENLRFFGCGYDQGGMADYFTVPANRLHVIPEELDDRQAALIEPLSTPVHAARLAGDLTGKKVAILGCGTIGLLMLAAARHFGAASVVMTDMLAAKRRLADDLGADTTLDAASETIVQDVRAALGESADVVFDCVANRFTIPQAIAMALKAGTVVVVGVPGGDVAIPMPLVQDQQVRIQGSATYLPEDYRISTEMIVAGEVDATKMVTATYPLAQVAEAFAAAENGEHIKVLVRA